MTTILNAKPVTPLTNAATRTMAQKGIAVPRNMVRLLSVASGLRPIGQEHAWRFDT